MKTSEKNSSLTPCHLYGTNDFSHNLDFLEKWEGLKVRCSEFCLELWFLIREGRLQNRSVFNAALVFESIFASDTPFLNDKV